jgi:hypothetical protein
MECILRLFEVSIQPVDNFGLVNGTATTSVEAHGTKKKNPQRTFMSPRGFVVGFWSVQLSGSALPQDFAFAFKPWCE